MRSVTSRWLLCFVVTAGLMGVRASYAADKWLEVRSRNFILVGNASESQIRRVGRNLEEFRAGFSNLFPAISREASSPITVVVFKDDAAFRPFKPLYEGKPASVAGSHAHRLHQRFDVARPRRQWKRRTSYRHSGPP